MPRNHLDGRSAFIVSNYIAAHADELRALPDNATRLAHIQAATRVGLITPANLKHACTSAGVELEVRRKSVSLDDRLTAIEERLTAIESVIEQRLTISVSHKETSLSDLFSASRIVDVL